MSEREKNDMESPVEAQGEVVPAPGEEPGAEERLADAHNRLLRVTAEYQNYQKRMARELSETGERARAAVLKELLEVQDDLERALAAAQGAKEAQALTEGVRMTQEHLKALLARYNVSPMDTLGGSFNPEKHEAIMRQPTADAEPMTVLHEIRKGYTMGGRVLRPARVVVAVEPEAEPGSDEAGE